MVPQSSEGIVVDIASAETNVKYLEKPLTHLRSNKKKNALFSENNCLNEN